MFLGYNVPAAFKLKFGWFPAPERSQPFKLLVCILSVSKRQPTKDDSMQKLAAARPGWPGDTELDKRVGRNIENGLPIHARGESITTQGSSPRINYLLCGWLNSCAHHQFTNHTALKSSYSQVTHSH
jgi:hypothetical protein